VISHSVETKRFLIALRSGLECLGSNGPAALRGVKELISTHGKTGRVSCETIEVRSCSVRFVSLAEQCAGRLGTEVIGSGAD